MNPLTKDGNIPKAIQSVIRANDSLLMRLVFDCLTGKYCAHCKFYIFPFREDAFGNAYLDSDGFAIEGCAAWEARMQKHFWARVKAEELGIDPKVLFRLPDAPPAENSDKQTLHAVS